ncbi:hypothetical protein AT984_07045 [Paucibacter sp. KCTC 42545]|nr:hypothetical protein AT984_07045 [Paucibacter sp. KCTC 42545]
MIRQVEKAEAYAAANGLVIDRALSFRDLGVSAWDKTNVNKGALSLFLQAIQAGKVPSGATLIIESFDRLSRATPREALNIFMTIVEAGLNLVTLTDPPKKFSTASIDQNMFQLFEALMEMNRANAESNLKSDRLCDSWERRRQLAVTEKKPMTGMVPMWINVDGPPRNRTYSLNTERVEVIKRIVKLAMDGAGNHSIVNLLNQDTPPWSRSQKEDDKRTENGTEHHWQPSYIQKVLINPALYGGIKVKGVDEVIPGFYPPVISYDEFVFLQSKRATRAKGKASTRKGKTVTNLFSGLLTCGYCNSAMHIGSYTSTKTKIQTKYFGCYGARTGSTECRMHGWSIDEFEKDMLFWLTNIDFAKVIGAKDASDMDAARSALATLAAKVSSLNSKITNIQESIAEGAKGMVKLLNQAIDDLEAAEKLHAEQERKVHAMVSRGSSVASVPQGWLVLFRALRDTTDEVQLRVLREKISTEIHQVVERIEMFPMGRDAKETAEQRYANIHFVGGESRVIEAPEC